MSAQHLSFDELAELADGLLSRGRARDAQRHLDDCDECRAHAVALRNTTSALRELPALTMPADVAARLDRALANARHEPVGSTVVPDLAAVRRRRHAPPRWLYAAAAAVAVVAGVSIALTAPAKHKGVAATQAGPVPLVATTAPQSVIEEESGRVYTPSSLAALAPGLVRADVAAGSAAGTGSSGGSAPLAQAPVAPRAGTASTPSDKSAAPQTAPGAANLPEQQFSASVVPSPLRRYSQNRNALLACAAFITDTPDATPLVVDYARWSNPATNSRPTPALIMVFTDARNSGRLDIYVVGPACDDAALLDYQVVSTS